MPTSQMAKLGLQILMIGGASAMLAFGQSVPQEGESSPPPTAQQVLTKFVHALGGEMGILAVEPLTISGIRSFGVLQPMREEFRMTFMDDKFYGTSVRTDSRGTRKFEVGSDGKMVWDTLTQGGKVRTQKISHQLLESQMERAGHPRLGLMLANYPGTVQVLGKKTVQDRLLVELEFLDANGSRTIRLFDDVTGLMVASSRETPGVDDASNPLVREIRYEYQQRGEVRFLKKLETFINSQPESSTEFTSIQICDPTDESLFSVPEGSAAENN